jgi:hypothetical protein
MPTPESFSSSAGHRNEILSELNALDLSREKLESMSPDDVNTLFNLVGELHKKLQQSSGAEQQEKLFKITPTSEKAKSLLSSDPKTKEEAILTHIETQSEAVKDFYRRLIDDRLLGCVITQKLKEYETEHWQEVIGGELEKGFTPFGDERQFLIDFYKKKGVDLVNPSQGDAKKFFDLKQYWEGPIGSELNRRRDETSTLTEQERTDAYVLFGALFQISDGKGGTTHLSGEAYREKLLELKEKLSQ